MSTGFTAALIPLVEPVWLWALPLALAPWFAKPFARSRCGRSLPAGVPAMERTSFATSCDGFCPCCGPLVRCFSSWRPRARFDPNSKACGRSRRGITGRSCSIVRAAWPRSTRAARIRGSNGFRNVSQLRRSEAERPIRHHSSGRLCRSGRTDRRLSTIPGRSAPPDPPCSARRRRHESRRRTRTGRRGPADEPSDDGQVDPDRFRRTRKSAHADSFRLGMSWTL